MVVPALVHDGRLYIESMDIISNLDETWPANPLLPADPRAAKLAEELVELGKELHRSVRYVSFNWGLGKIGKINADYEKTVQRLEARGSPEKLADFYSKFNNNEIDEATNLQHLQALEAGWAAQAQRLQDGRAFLTGESFSKADIIWAIKTLRRRLILQRLTIAGQEK